MPGHDRDQVGPGGVAVAHGLIACVAPRRHQNRGRRRRVAPFTYPDQITQPVVQQMAAAAALVSTDEQPLPDGLDDPATTGTNR